MSTLILYYSYSGNTRHVAEDLSAELSADLAEVFDAKKPSKAKAYLSGCLKAMQGKAWPVKPLGVDLAAYERIILMSPIWAGNVPPAVNALWDLLPVGTALEVKLVSASGQSNCHDRLAAVLAAKGCSLAGLEDIRMR